MTLPALPPQNSASWYAHYAAIDAAVRGGGGGGGSTGVLNVKDYGAKGDGTTDDTAAIQSAWAVAGRIWFPPGTYRYTGSGLSGYAGPQIIGAGTDATYITLGASSRLLDGNEPWNSLRVADLTTSGGVGVIRNRYTGSNVAGHFEVARCTFLDYTGTAVAANSSDMPYWKIHHNQFRAAADYATSKGVAFTGAADQSDISNNSFLRNRVHIHLANPSGVRIIGNDLIRWSATAPSPRVDVWLQPGVVYNAAACEIAGNKFGGENLAVGDYRIVFADATTGTGAHDRFPVFSADSANELDGVTIRDNHVGGTTAAPLPFVYSTTPYVVGCHFSGVFSGNEPTHILQFRTPPGDSTRLSTNVFGPFQQTAGYTSVDSTSTSMSLTNAIGDLGPLLDPLEVFSGRSQLQTPGGADPAQFVAFSSAISSWLLGSGVTTGATTDALGGTDALEVTYTSLVTSSSIYIQVGTAGVVPGRPLWLEVDIAAGSSSPLNELVFAVGPGSYGGQAFRRFIQVPASGWRRYRFQWTPYSTGPYYPAIMWAAGSTGTKVKVGRPRIYHGQEPVPASPYFAHAVTTTTAPAAGGAGALPATPAGYLTVYVNGTARKLPYY